MKLFRIKPLDGVNSLSVFHAAAKLGIECIIVTSPNSTFVSTGYFDNARLLLDGNRLAAGKIKVFRRKIGGGTVLLDSDQVFYQVVLKRNSPILPKVVKNAYRKFSKPPIKAFKRLGVNVEYRPINDLVVTESQEKISGQGAGVVEDSFVFAGNILIDFNHQLMADIVNVPDEKRTGLVEMLRKNVTSLAKVLGEKPDKEEVATVLAESFLQEYPDLEEAEPPDKLFRVMNELSDEMTADDYVYEERGRTHDKIKIREDVFFDIR